MNACTDFKQAFKGHGEFCCVRQIYISTRQ